LLDHEFSGQIGDVLADIARSGGEPMLHAERVRPDKSKPSSWILALSGDGTIRRFEANGSIIAIAIASHVWLSDAIDDLTFDVSQRFADLNSLDGLDGHLPWPRQPSNRGPS
jgi:hypothetical protein